MYKSASKLLKQLNILDNGNGGISYDSMPQTDSLDTDLEYLIEERLISSDMAQMIYLTNQGKVYAKTESQRKKDLFIRSFLYPAVVAIIGVVVGFLLAHYV